ncbi:MAG TPA: BamA/TamA family outer membrane protein, partial [Candidatus Nitrosotenuis sp.]|nr:BamA/TamA family outer membrane protein [Candidatus Nitrosotenuis sp.]
YGRTLSDDWRAFITLRRETIEIIEDEDSDFTPFGVGKGDLNSVSLASLFDTRDDVFNPHLGQYANGSFTVSGGLLGGSFDFTKLQAEYRHYLPLGARQTLATRIMGGILNGGAPLSEFFFVGGTDTLRAYRDNSFFGNRFVVANVEYRFPLFNIKFLNGAVFADGGGAWIPGTTAAQLHGDAGVGLRIVFPSLGLGVIRVDYAHGDQGGRTTIGIGQSF